MTAARIVALIHPEATFAGLADILGFVFLLIGVLWMVQAFMERVLNPFWWMTLISGILMVGIRSGSAASYSHARGRAACVRRHLGGDEGHHRHRAGPSNSPPGFLPGPSPQHEEGMTTLCAIPSITRPSRGRRHTPGRASCATELAWRWDDQDPDRSAD
jgi:hypothetical protein